MPRDPSEDDRDRALNHELYNSIYLERIHLLGRLKAYRERLELIHELTKNPQTSSKLPTLLRIRAIAEEALAL